MALYEQFLVYICKIAEESLIFKKVATNFDKTGCHLNLFPKQPFAADRATYAFRTLFTDNYECQT